MKIVSYIEDINDIELFKSSNVGDAIISGRNFSRLGRLSVDDSIKLATACREKGLRPILEFDILMTEDKFSEAVVYLTPELVSSFDAIRVQDAGAYNYILENFSDIKIQLILEYRSHNITGIKKWIGLAGDRLDRIVLSIELSKYILSDYIKQLDVPVEFLGIGRILSQYTPRHLLRHQFGEYEGEMAVIADSEESPHKGFPIIENRHGTFTFNYRDYCVLDSVKDLKEMGLAYLRVDLRFEKDNYLLSKISELSRNYSSELFEEIKEKYSTPTIKSFFDSNKSDILFDKLKNKRIQRDDNGYLGDVVEVKKKSHIAIMLRSRSLNIKLGDKIVYITPEGKKRSSVVTSMTDVGNKKINEGQFGKIVIINHTGSISTRTAVYIDNTDS